MVEGHNTTRPGALVIVRRNDAHVYAQVSRSLSASPGVPVIQDRRLGDRRQRAARVDAERRRADRRATAAEVQARGWAVVRLAPLDADERAIFFLCCENHVVLCARCRKSRTVRQLRCEPGDPGRYHCPKCRVDLTNAVLAHTTSCHYFRSRTPLAEIERQEVLTVKRETA